MYGSRWLAGLGNTEEELLMKVFIEHLEERAVLCESDDIGNELYVMVGESAFALRYTSLWPFILAMRQLESSRMAVYLDVFEKRMAGWAPARRQKVSFAYSQSMRAMREFTAERCPGQALFPVLNELIPDDRITRRDVRFWSDFARTQLPSILP
jgi:hypothetical protein